MVVSDFIRSLQALAARLKAESRGYWAHVAEVLLGILFLTALAPEMLSVWEFGDFDLRDANGVLSDTKFWALVAVTIISCLIINLVIFHLALRHVTEKLNSTWLAAIGLAIVALVILAPQFSNVVRGLPMGNSLDAVPGDLASLKMDLMATGGLVRGLLVGLGTIVASIGLTMIGRGWSAAVKAARANRDAKTIDAAIVEIDTGYKKASEMPSIAAEYNRDRAAQFARAVAEGMEDHARTISRYLNGIPGRSVNPEQWLQNVRDQFKAPFVPTDKLIAEQVERRLQQHRIELSLLPNTPEKIPADARTELAEFADWLREQADFDAIVNEIERNKEPAYV